MMMDSATLIGIGWKSAAIAGLTLMLLRIVRSRSAAERSLVAHVGLAALLALPLATLLLPQWAPLPASWAVEVGAVAPSADLGGAPVMADVAVGSAVSSDAMPPVSAWALPALSDLMLWVYAMPLLLLTGVMMLAVVRLFAMRGRADVLVEASWLSALAEAQRRMGFKHGTALLVSDELRSPISWGVLRPTIVLSPKAVAAVGEAEAIIAHELAHVARLDWAKLLAARLACAVFWFNPLVWMLARESHQLREEAADDAVLMADIDGPDYATLLVGAARHDNKAALLAAHGVAPGRDSLKRRITRVLDGRALRGPASGRWVAASLAVLAGVTMPLAAFSATAIEEIGDSPVASVVPVKAVPSAVAVGGAVSAVAATDAVAGDAALPVDKLIGMRAVGVTPDDVRKMRDDRGSVDVDDVIAAKATGVDSSYIAQMRRLFPSADVGEMIGARAMGVDAAYARDIQSQFPGVGLGDLTGMRAVGVDGAFLREMRRAGVRLRTPDEAIAMRASGGWALPSPPQTPRRETRSNRESRSAVERGVETRIDMSVGDDGPARPKPPAPPEPPSPTTD